MSSVGTLLVDAHLHLQEAPLAADLEAVMGRAIGQGVAFFVCNGSSEEDWPAVLALARRDYRIIPCFGLHPWYVSQRTPGWEAALEQHLDAAPSGMGEIGLDRWIEPRDEAAQELVFRRQWELAAARGLPVMVHCVRAWGWLMEVLQELPPLSAGMLLHAYGGPAELIAPLAAKGAYFSYGGRTLDDRQKGRRATLLKIPHDRLLLETDAPDLPPPEPFWKFKALDASGKARNEPANLRPICEGIAALLQEPEAALAERLWENSQRFFGRFLH